MKLGRSHAVTMLCSLFAFAGGGGGLLVAAGSASASPRSVGSISFVPKFDPGGCAGPGASGSLPFYPPTCSWNLYAGQSLDLLASPAKGVWTTAPVTTTPVHVGDICNLGIFCVSPASNRDLLDFISETVAPSTGYAHIAFADDNMVTKLRAANQVSGPSVLGKPAASRR
jgi:hypothetical protein